MPRRRIILLFPTTHAVMQAAHLLEAAGLPQEVIPRPKGMDADCGIALAVAPELRDGALAVLAEGGSRPSKVLEFDQPDPRPAAPGA